MTEPTVQALEAELAGISRTLTEPGERECLRCYLLRMLNEFGCSGGLRWVEYWRDLRAPRAQALARRFARRGAFCDCEVVLSVYAREAQIEQLGPCAGVRRGSTQPCLLTGGEQRGEPA